MLQQATNLGVSDSDPTVVSPTKGILCSVIPLLALVTIKCKLIGGFGDLVVIIAFVDGSAYGVDGEEVEEIEGLGIKVLGKAYLVGEDKEFA